MAILIFLIVLFFLVLVHEFGHFIIAKKTGMRVDEFGIGFPPKLFGIKKGETEYTLNLLPIGGFVKILGEDGMGTAESLDDAARDRSFVGKSKWAQTAVLVAGVSMNILFAWFLFTVALSVGTPTAVSEAEATEEARLVITEVLPESSAGEQGIPRGAVVTGLRSGNVSLLELTPLAFSEFTARHADNEFELSYRVGEKDMTAPVALRSGLVSSEPDREAVGVALTLIEIVSMPVYTAVYESALMTVRGLRDITVGISSLLWDALRLKADFSHVAGPVGIVGLVGEASAYGFSALLMFTAFISLNLAIINLLPFPALDGGRLLFVAIEAIKGSPINPSWVATLNTIGFALLILLMVAVTWSDIVKII